MTKDRFCLVKGNHVFRSEKRRSEEEKWGKEKKPQTHNVFFTIIHDQHFSIRLIKSLEKLEREGYDKKAV